MLKATCVPEPTVSWELIHFVTEHTLQKELANRHCVDMVICSTQWAFVLRETYPKTFASRASPSGYWQDGGRRHGSAEKGRSGSWNINVIVFFYFSHIWHGNKVQRRRNSTSRQSNHNRYKIIYIASLTSSGSSIANRVADKLTQVYEKIWCCRSGSAGDTLAINDIVQY